MPAPSASALPPHFAREILKVGIFLGFRIPKGKRTSNWAAKQLSPQQIEYAATDAWACREIDLRYRELGML